MLYLQTKSERKDGTYHSYLTTELESKEAPLWWQTRGLYYTATGYGRRIPTTQMVKYNGRWRRVYCCIFSNIGTCYIGKLSDSMIITD